MVGTKTAARLTPLMLVVLTLSGCWMSDPVSPLGVQAGPADTYTVFAQLCPNEKITAVALYRASSSQRSADALWSVRSTNGRGAERVTIGSRPPGFVTVTPLAVRVRTNEDYLVDAATNRRELGTVQFSPSELAPGLVIGPAGPQSLSEWQAAASKGASRC